MQAQKYILKFNTPAFLGNARQQGQWRTPPFKALIRHWWRIVVAHRYDYDWRQIYEQEKLFFGHASGDSPQKSQLLLRLSSWSSGRLQRMPSGKKIKHPEVRFPIDAHLYLGYGPLGYKDRKTILKHPPALGTSEQVELRLSVPNKYQADLLKTMQLIQLYGTLGGRSRNAWGSLQIQGLKPLTSIQPFLREWHQCLEQEWAHAIGQDDEGALIWQTEPRRDGLAVINDLAQLKIALRTQFKFQGKRYPQNRHWLSYPVTNHAVNHWKRANFRFPNPLRFKVRFKPDSHQYQGILVHLPCRPEIVDRNDKRSMNDIKKTWRQVHQYLDSRLERSAL